MSDTTEIWASLAEYGDYEVSSHGRFRKASTRQPISVSFSLSNGYGYVALRKAGKARNYRAHRLVLIAHRGVPAPGMEGRHLDGDKANNWLSNLAWGTNADNFEDKVRHGRNKGAHLGERHHNAKLTEPDVETIRRLSQDSWKQRDIAARFGITQSNVSKIITGASRTSSANATQRAEMRLAS